MDNAQPAKACNTRVAPAMTMDEALQFLAAAGDKPPMATWDSEDYLWDPQGLVAHQIGEHPVGPCSGMPASPMAAPRTGSQDGEEGPSGRDPSYGDTSGGGARSSKGRFNAPSVKHGNGRPNKCQSDGCDKDLASLTYYHVRNRICDLHIKADVFTREGEQLRFCQRCGYAHPLAEFDGLKHSCRAQLQKHNERRRKKKAGGASSKEQEPKPCCGSKKETSSSSGAARPSTQSHVQLVSGSGSGSPTANAQPPFGINPAGPFAAVSGATEDDKADPPPLPVLDFDVPDDLLHPGQGANAPNLVDELAEWMASQIADQDATSNTAAVPNIVQSIDELSSPLFPMRRLPTAGSGSFEHAVSLMHSGAASGVPPPPPPMSHEAKLATVSLKLFGCTPAELPADLRAQLVTWFDGQVTSMEGYLRPGCVHLTVEAVLDGNQPDHQQQQQKQEAEPQVQNKSCCGGKACGSKRSEPEGGADVAALPPKAGPIANVRTLVERMLATGEGLWKVKTFVIQYINEVGLVSGGRLQATWDVKDLPTGRAPPSVTEVSPTVLLAGAPRAQLLIRGMNLLQNDTEVLCRSHGKYVAVESAGCADCRCKTRVSASCGGSKDGASALMERTCCGCCVSKLANLSLAESEAPSCCSGGSTPPPKPAVEAVSLQTLKVTAEVPSQAGVLYVDVNKKLVLAPRGGRILVVDDQDVYKELLELECSDRSAATAWSSALGVVYEWVGDRTKVQYAFVEKVIVKLLHAAIGAGLAAVARQLHGLLQAEVMSAAESASHLMAAKGIDGLALLAQVDQACKAVALRWIAQLGGQDGTTLLHLAVQSQKAGMLDMVLGWGVDAGQPWRCDAPGVGCVTPLHLAAVAADGFQAAQLVLALVTKCQPGAVAWREAKDAEGRSPADYAAAIGHAGLVSTFGGPKPMEGEAKKEKIEPASAHPSLPKLAVKRAPDARAAPPMEAPSTPRRCKCKGPCPCAAAPEPCASCCSSDEEEDGCCGGKSGVCGCCASMATLTLGQAPAKSCCAK